MKKENKTVTFKTLLIKRIIFLIIFASISIGITAFLIINPFGKKENSKDISKENINNTVNFGKIEHKSLLDYDNDTFDYNDLNTVEINEKYDEYDILYFKIDGLKNKEIQNKINNNLENDVKNAIIQAEKDGKIKGNFSSGGFVASSFANTLSISYNLSSNIYDESKDENTYEWNQYISENYDLTTGKRLQIQDLFTEDTLGSELFNNQFYNELVSTYTDQNYYEDDYEAYITVKDYKDIDEKMLEFAIKYNQGDDIPFYFDEQTITLSEYYSRIFFEDHLDCLAIYNKFKTSESIFDGRFEKIHDLPVLTKRYPAYFQVLEESKNYYMDINWSFLPLLNNKDVENTITKAVNDYINSDIEQIKENSKSDEKFNICNYAYELYEYNDIFTFHVTKARMETTKSLFNNELKEKIKSIFRETPRVDIGDSKLYNNLFFYYMYGDDYDYEQVKKDWNLEDFEIFLDRDGNIYETMEEAQNPNSIPAKD